MAPPGLTSLQGDYNMGEERGMKRTASPDFMDPKKRNECEFTDSSVCSPDEDVKPTHLFPLYVCGHLQQEQQEAIKSFADSFAMRGFSIRFRGWTIIFLEGSWPHFDGFCSSFEREIQDKTPEMYFIWAPFLFNQLQYFSKFELMDFSTELEFKEYFKKYSAIHCWKCVADFFSYGFDTFCLDELEKPEPRVIPQDTETVSDYSDSEADSEADSEVDSEVDLYPEYLEAISPCW